MGSSRRTVLRGLGGAAVCGVTGTFVYGRLVATDGSAAGTDIDALVAGSLLGVARRLGGATIEAHGSAAVRRLILNTGRSPDAVALADPRLFNGVAGRATLFATNALVLAYDRESAHAPAIERDWRAAIRDIERTDIEIGRTDPDADPLGYRTVMALRLAEQTYRIDAESVLDRSEVLPETDLLSVLDGGGLDAAFAYRNMAVERGIKYRSLPTRIDFSDPARADSYGRVSYDLDGKSIEGAPIRYAAAATTAAGEPWVERLVTAGAALQESGFEVPAAYPIRDASVGTN
jgi:molybdate/tungstate transport system substrate-binding protein